MVRGVAQADGSIRSAMDELAQAFRTAWPPASREPWPQTVVVAWLHTRDWIARLQAAGALLTEQERYKVGRQRDSRDRNAHALAYAFHRLVLADLLGCEPDEVPVYRDAKGCPRVAGLPNLGTSLSHGRELVAIAVSGSGPVGVDIEPLARAAAMPEIAMAVVHPEDGLLPPSSQAGRSVWASDLLRLWVRKEAVLKAAGIGLECPMDQFAARDGAVIALPGNPSSRVRVCMVDAGREQIMAVAADAALPKQVVQLQPPP